MFHFSGTVLVTKSVIYSGSWDHFGLLIASIVIWNYLCKQDYHWKIMKFIPCKERILWMWNLITLLNPRMLNISLTWNLLDEANFSWHSKAYLMKMSMLVFILLSLFYVMLFSKEYYIYRRPFLFLLNLFLYSKYYLLLLVTRVVWSLLWNIWKTSSIKENEKFSSILQF